MTAFASVILDADSTLASIEGVDWLAGLRGPDVAERVAALTGDAMAGRVPLESVYAGRLGIIAPTARELDALGRAYVEALVPGAVEALGRLRAAGVALRVVSGGIRRGLLPMTRALGFRDDEVRAVDVATDAGGGFQAVLPSPLATRDGKASVARSLGLPRPTLAVGDGATDLAMRPEVDAFAAYVGVVRREEVAARADFVVASFAEVESLVLG